MPPPRAPERIRSTADLRAFQRLMLQAVTRPLGPRQRARRGWTRGVAAETVIGSFAAPSRELSAFERIEIYNRMYWFRTLDSLYDDLPGLSAVLGEKKFLRLLEAYLVACPSRSFTLRDLPSRLEGFIRTHPRWTAPHTALAADMAAYEWAQVESFDAGARPVMTPDDLADRPPARLTLALQPHLRLLALWHPVEDYALAVKRSGLRADTSNAVDAAPKKADRTPRAPRRPKRERVFLAVHRHEGRIYTKRLEPAAFAILTALRAGRPLSRAVAAAGPRVTPEQVQADFALWSRLGWLCRRK